MKRDKMAVISLRELMDIASKCNVGRGDYWLDYSKLLEALQNFEPCRAPASTPNNLDSVIDSAFAKKYNEGKRFVKTKAELADLLTVSRKTLYAWENERVLVLEKGKNGYSVQYALNQLVRYRHKRNMKRSKLNQR